MTASSIRSMTSADSEVLSAFGADAFVESWPAASLAGLLESPGAFGLLMDDADGPRGVVVVQAAGGEAEILTVIVRPDARRRGFGRALVEAATAEAAARGAGALYLEVAVDNAPARGLYGALGFGEVGRRKGYYTRENGPRIDALILKRELASAP